MENNGKREVSFAIDQDEMKDLLATIAGGRGSVPEKIGAAARALGWTYRRAKGHWYGDAKRIDSHELTAARLAARRQEEMEIRAENQQLRSRLAVLEARLSMGDSDFHQPTRDALRQQMGRAQRMADGD